MKPKSQKEIEEKAIRERKAVSNDTKDTRPGFARRGIKIHDQGPDSWGINRLERYEHD